MHDTLPLLNQISFPSLQRASLDTLQVNLGYKCNQSCLHCHVNAGPTRTEMMDPDTLALILPVLAARQIGTLDLTGGAPELHDGFRSLVCSARSAGVRVLDRCNLTVLSEPRQQGLAEFLATQRVEVVAALMNARSRCSGVATGDQAMFMTRAAFDAVGGFACQPLMEDIGMSARMHKLSRPACLRAKVLTSGRRWETHVVWRTIGLMWWLRLAYWCGAAPQSLARRYP